MEVKECKQYMWIIMHVHLQLSLISHELNKVFSVQMSVQMVSYFAFIVNLCREIYTEYINKNSTTYEYVLDSMLAYISGIIYSAIILILNYICEIVYSKANETIVILCKISNNNLAEDLRTLTLQFMSQVKQTEIKFGSGSPYFGYDFIRQFYMAIVTVLMIMIQMPDRFNY
ncbi:PREDICTED: uncharacterized protein LOC105564405 [Vollenhovia emeryi]|uniref:uncharacterized protein LOC105564405 n=1 Tax=Vollenhovia emeryi TaxID=411798 RepID=UPI0005F43B36|nr:PREDICTED: uncharacterized protein LOC105564405 [Vollenhovia emeryi]